MRRLARRGGALGIAAVSAAALVAFGAQRTLADTPTAAAPSAATAATGCQLGNGVKHVINIIFDNVHFFRDNPNVPSDLEQMPHLLNFLRANGTVLSNMHTPLIAHTADDSLAIYTGLYGDRHGQPVSNSYKTYKPGRDDRAGRRRSCTGRRRSSTPTNPPSRHDGHGAVDGLLADGSGRRRRARADHARAVGAVHPGRLLGRRLLHRQHGAGEHDGRHPDGLRPELAGGGRTAREPDVQGPRSRYIGEAVHCATGRHRPARTRPVPWPTRSPTANRAGLPRLPGAVRRTSTSRRRSAAARTVGTTATGSTDADGQPRRPRRPRRSRALQRQRRASPASARPRRRRSPSSPTCRRPASRSPTATSPTCTSARPDERLHDGAPRPRRATPLGPGDACYVENAQRTTPAFETFFDRLAADGITPANTLFVIGAEENDQFAGANVRPGDRADSGRLRRRHHAAALRDRSDRRAAGQHPGLLTSDGRRHAPRSTSSRRAPRSTSTAGRTGTTRTVRQLERDTAAMTGEQPVQRRQPARRSSNYQAGRDRAAHPAPADGRPAADADLHHVPEARLLLRCDSRPADQRTRRSTRQSTRLRLGPRLLQPEHRHHLGRRSPVRAWRRGASTARSRPTARGSRPRTAAETVPAFEHQRHLGRRDRLRPTLLHLAGLEDDYLMDGRVITEVTRGGGRLQQTVELGACYKQLDASVGQFGTDTLVASTAALASGSDSQDGQVHRDRRGPLDPGREARPGGHDDQERPRPHRVSRWERRPPRPRGGARVLPRPAGRRRRAGGGALTAAH